MTTLAAKEPKKKGRSRSKSKTKSGRKSGRSGRGGSDENQLWVQVDEIKEIGKPTKDYYFIVYFNGEEVHVSEHVEGFVFKDAGVLLDFALDVDSITVEICERAKLTHKPLFKGKVDFDAEEVYHGYNYDSFMPLCNKLGEEKHGFAKIKMLFVKAGDKFSPTAFLKPLHYLTQENRPQYIPQKLEEGADISAVDTDGLTPFMLSCLLGRIECCQILADAGGNLGVFSRKGLNGLHLASMGGHSAIVSALIEFGIAADTKTDDRDKYTALHLAAKHCRYETVSILLEHGVEIDTVSKTGDTATGLALKSNGDKIARTLEALIPYNPNLFITNDEALAVWEIGMNALPEIRTAFLNILDIEHPLEFNARQKYIRYQRAEGTNLSSNWKTASQLIVTTEHRTPVSIIVHPKEKLQHNTSSVSDISYIITKSEEFNPYPITSYQTCTEEIITKSLTEFVFEKGFVYHIAAASKKQAGDFTIVIYYKTNKSNLQLTIAQDWEHPVEIDDEWDVESAGGNSFGSEEFFNNPLINVKFDGEIADDAVVSITLIQKSDALSVNLFDINSGRYYIGFFIIDPENKNLGNAGPWYNSTEVTSTFKVKDLAPTFDIVPCTQNPGELGEFTVLIKSNYTFQVE